MSSRLCRVARSKISAACAPCLAASRFTTATTASRWLSKSRCTSASAAALASKPPRFPSPPHNPWSHRRPSPRIKAMLPLAIGALIDQRFLLTEFVAEGGMSTVFRARDLQRNDVVAIKVLRSHDSATLQRFSRSASCHERLASQHRALCRARPDDQRRAPISRWVAQRKDLAARLSRGPLSVPEVIELGSAITSALFVAHRQV